MDVWQDVKPPEGTVLVPGVVTHATNLIEHPELVAQRIVRLAKARRAENVLAGTDCGFSQGPFSAKVHPSIQWAKLKALEGAELASKELWRRKAVVRGRRGFEKRENSLNQKAKYFDCHFHIIDKNFPVVPNQDSCPRRLPARII